MSKVFVHENELNVRIASILSESFGLDCRAERTHQRDRPDIRCFYGGFRIIVECSYSKSDAENDARRRIENGLADIAIALHYTEKYRDMPEEEFKKKLRESVFNAMIIVPREEKNLEKYILGKTRVAEPVEGWFINVKLGDLADLIKNAVAYLIEESEVQQEVEKVKQVISDFTRVAEGLPGSNKFRESIASALYRLYGFEITETRDAEVLFGQAALAILLSSVLYERVRYFHDLSSLENYANSYGAVNGLLKAFEALLKIDYEPALALAVDVLKTFPPALSQQVKNIVETASRISQMSSLLGRDFAGRIYHEITGDIAVRKGFATYYTEIPAAYILSSLAIKALLDIDDIGKLDKNAAGTILNTICKLKMVDFACGSGTLLTSSLYNASRIARNLCFIHNLECSCGDEEKSVSIEKKLIEEGIYGLDALRYATQITALNLALMVPEILRKENVVSVYLGVTSSGRAWLGSLELLDGVKTFGGLLRWIEGGLRGAVETVSTATIESGKIELLDSYDIVIMNPPFTRATGRISKEFEEERRGLFGFISNEKSREIIKKRYNEIRERVREDLRKIAKEFSEKEPALHEFRLLIQEREKKKKEEYDTDLAQYLNIGPAGEGLLFLYLAYKYVKPGGVIAFVLPRNVLSGVSWFLARTLLASKFHLKYVIVSHDGEKGFNFSEGTNLSESLIIAKKRDIHEECEETHFIELLRKPRTALEGLLYSDEITKAIKCGTEYVYVGDKLVARIRSVRRKDLLSFIINWGVFFLEDSLLEVLKGLLEENRIGTTHIPITILDDLIVNMGVNRGGDVIEAFNLIVRGARVNCKAYEKKTEVLSIPMVCGSGKEVAKTIEISPNAYVPDATNAKAERIKRLRSRFLVPNRVGWDTFHAVAHLATEPVISNVYFMVKTELDEKRLKALILWLNSFWGVLSIFSLMEVTGGVFTRLNIGQWKLLPVLDVRKLDDKTLENLSAIFDRYKNRVFGSLIEQFRDQTRLHLDRDIISAIGVQMDRSIEELYRSFYDTLNRMRRKSG